MPQLGSREGLGTVGERFDDGLKLLSVHVEARNQGAALLAGMFHEEMNLVSRSPRRTTI